MTLPANWIAFLAAFLLGSIPFGAIMARLYHKDIRREGSGNIGATNVSRVLGFWPAGAIVFLLDMAKGLGGTLLGSASAAWLWEGLLGRAPDFGWSAPWIAGLGAILGHCFSPWLRFKGGKGVATGFGAILVLSPWAALAGIVAFAFTFFLTRIGSLSSIAGLLAASAVHWVIAPEGTYLAAGAAMVAVILFRHETNIGALLENRENRF